MLLLLLQGEKGSIMFLYYSGITLSIMLLSWIPILKIGLIITHAEVKREWKWVLASSSIQAAAVFSVIFPIFLTIIISEMGGSGVSPEIGLIIGLMSLGLFIDLNIINVFHRVGIKRALIIFSMEIIPVIIVMIGILSEVGLTN